MLKMQYRDDALISLYDTLDIFLENFWEELQSCSHDKHASLIESIMNRKYRNMTNSKCVERWIPNILRFSF